MSFDVGGSSSDASQGASFNQSVFNDQIPALKELYASMGSLFGDTQEGMQGAIPGATEQMGDIYEGAKPAWEQQLGGGVYEGMDLQGKFEDTLNQPSAVGQMNEMIMGGEGNNYVGAMKRDMESDAFRNLGRQYAGIDSRAGASGLPGSSRHGLLQARAYEDTADALADAQTKLGYETFDTDLERKLGIARSADSNRMQEQQTLASMLGEQNRASTGGLNFGMGMQQLGMGQFAPYMAPWQAATQYANTIGRPTVLGSGTSSGESSGSSMNAGGSWK